MRRGTAILTTVFVTTTLAIAVGQEPTRELIAGVEIIIPSVPAQKKCARQCEMVREYCRGRCGPEGPARGSRRQFASCSGDCTRFQIECIRSCFPSAFIFNSGGGVKGCP